MSQELKSIFERFGTRGFILSYEQYLVWTKYFFQYKDVVPGCWTIYFWPNNNFITTSKYTSEVATKCLYMTPIVNYFAMSIHPRFISQWFENFEFINDNSVKPNYIIYDFESNKLISYRDTGYTTFDLRCTGGICFSEKHATPYRYDHQIIDEEYGIICPYTNEELIEFTINYNRPTTQQRSEIQTQRSEIQIQRSETQSSDIRIVDNESEETEIKNCVICLDGKPNHVLVPCGHLCLCQGCKSNYNQFNSICPICRVKIQSIIKIFY